MRFIMATVVLVSVSSLTFAQAPAASKTADDKPQTKVDAFQRQTGNVIIKGYTEVGGVTGLGSVSVTAIELTNAGTGEKQYGVTIEVKESGRLERENRSFLDADEIEPLLAGLDYIARASAKMTNFKNFEAIYKTRGDVRLVVFSSNNGKLSAAVQVGTYGSTTAYLEMSKLTELRSLLGSAKQLIDQNGGATKR